MRRDRMRSKFYIGLAAAIILCPIACESQPEIKPTSNYMCPDLNVTEEQSATYSGFYVGGFETSTFIISNHCEVWLRDDMCMISDDINCFQEMKAYITVEGLMSPPGHFGHLGGWDRELR